MATVNVGQLITELLKHPMSSPVQIRFCIMLEHPRQVDTLESLELQAVTTDCDLELEDIEATADKVYLLTSTQKED